ncbi:MAG: magnesium transporter [Woeseia sp.]
MSVDAAAVDDALNSHFLARYPLDAAREIETLDTASVVSASSRVSAKILAPVWQRLLPERAARLLESMPAATVKRVLEELSPPHAVRILGYMAPDLCTARLAELEPVVREELTALMAYPPNTAGRLMDSSVSTFRRTATAGQSLRELRNHPMKTARSLFLVDDKHTLTGKVTIQAVALASPETTLGELEEPLAVALRPIDPLDAITTAFETYKVLDIPVVDLDGVFLGAVMHDRIARTMHQQSSLDMQAMVGASRDERALSSPFFTVRKRMPWLQINLLTAFMAAAVVGVFEATIAQVTALAVLLPVVAGQSGNAGAQALAVTMRGLALREITIRQWFRVMRKEVFAGFMNGVGVAITCGIGVFVWSGSVALVGVIAVSMVLAMVAAGFAGALIPIMLTKLGQDPATSSSILLTTVTDVAGFFSFLGIATIFMRFL